MSFFEKLGHAIENAPEIIDRGITHTAATIEGILDPNRRHNSAEEKLRDRIRTEINNSHRFQSFANQRSGNFVKWHIDGHDYFYAVSELLDSARQVIMIMDWWLSPELYLRRPAAYHPEWRIDRLLKRKAAEGVKVYIIVYKEVSQTMTMDSHHTKMALEALHENIAVMRHPDHLGSEDDVEIWSHHEKVIVVDNHRACIGGLDLCYGRWDSHNHPLADAHLAKFALTLFPGQDYNNARILDFQKVESYASNQLSILDSPRMPWHDVHMSLTGPVVLDIVQHFVERWNEVKKRKYKDDARYDWLALPHDIQLAPNEAVLRHPHREQWQRVGQRFRQRFHIMSAQDELAEDEDEGVYPRHPQGSMRVQVVRSVSDWSNGVLTESSIQNAYIQLILEANHYIYIENQFFISNTQTTGPIKNLIAKALVERILHAAKERRKFKVVVVIPEVPGFAGDIQEQTPIKTIMAAQWRTINRGGYSIYEEITKAGYDPKDYIRFYHLRTYDRINASASSISAMEKNTGVSVVGAQAALARLWLGETYGQPHVQNKVAIKVPDPVRQATVDGSKESKKNVEESPLVPTTQEARELIRRFESGSTGVRDTQDVSDSVASHTLISPTSLSDEQWSGTEEEERAAYVSELLYIHSKVMIVDDRRVIMGSANLNDRSQKGNGDSEIALVVEDTEEIPTYMDGRRYMATRFAASLRRKLYREHLGLIPAQNVTSANEHVDPFMRAAPYPNPDETRMNEDEQVADPLSDQVLELWEGTAKRNRDIYTEIFRPVPSDLVHNWEAYKNFVPKVKSGHVVPEVSLERIKNRLSQVRGQLVEMPLQFLIEEKELVEGTTFSDINLTLRIYV